MAGEQFKGNPEKQIRDYNAGDFQNTDPVTGEARELPEDTTGQPVEQIQNPNDPAVKAANAAGKPAAGSNADVEATDAARELADEEGIDLSTVKATGASGQITVGDVRDAVAKRDK